MGIGKWPGMIGRSLFGRVQWQPPTWLALLLAALARAVAALRRRRRQQPASFYAALAVLAACSGGAFFGWKWYERRPKPLRFSVVISSPEATPLTEAATPALVVIDFGGSAAPLDRIGKPLDQGPTSKPELKGSWTWVTDRRLQFTPSGDWPVAQEYRVTLAKTMLPPHVLLETYDLSFSTAKFTVNAVEQQFYTDLRDPKLKQVLFTLKASHPFSLEELRQHLTLKRREMKDGKLQLAAAAIPYTATLDKYKGTASIVSANIPVPLETFTVVAEISPGMRSANGGEGTAEAVSDTVAVPGMYDYFKISSAQTSFVRNERNEPEQILIIETSAPALQAELQKALHVYELPKDRPASPGHDKVENHRWSAAEISPAILAASKKVELKAIPTAREFDTAHTFRYQGTAGRFLFVRVDQGVKAYGDYVLVKPFEDTTQVIELPREVQIMHEGSILSLSGDKKISVVARDLDAIKFHVGRVLPAEINHLITQTYGKFQNPVFDGWRFRMENIAESFDEIRPLAVAAKGKTQYTYFDFAKYLQTDSGERRGLFMLKAEGWNPAQNSGVGVSDERFILITDLGLVVKTAKDGSKDAFVVSIRSGKPVAGVRVEVLGKNGLQIIQQTTDDQGHARFPPLRDFDREKEPTVYLATKDRDLSFLPYDRADRQLNLSRFEVGGEASAPAEGGLMAYLYSDRGIYRPGDPFHIGIIVKDAKWQRPLKELPLEVVITDPRGVDVKKERVKVEDVGFNETMYQPAETAPTGDYQVSLYVIREDNQRRDWLSSTSVRVEEFVPDRMRIAARFSHQATEGWVKPDDLQGHVTLANLFGTPAADRRVTGRLRLVPWSAAFRSFKDFVFFDPQQAKTSYSEATAEQKTDDHGEADFVLDLKHFAPATYRLTFAAEGFEAEGGRGVSAQVSTLVSPSPYMLGYKADGALGYLPRASQHHVEVLAVDPAVQQIAVEQLTQVLYQVTFASVLTKQPSGIYKYESVRKEVSLKTSPLQIAAKGSKLALDTSKPGDFILVLRDAEQHDLSRIAYSVIGAANLSRSLERDAELQLKLAKSDYDPGEMIEMEMIAPYSGAGLITIEKDRVYSHQWFYTKSNATVQTIAVPADLEGNGYLTVTFLRDIASKDIYMSPLSTAVVPFSVNREKRVNRIKLGVPSLIEPGSPLKITYRTASPGRIAVYVVEEGILQVARYQMPDPLGSFFRKKALEVTTAQILDLILPEFSIVSALAAPGGDRQDALASNLNPFKRRRQKPVAYWSGLLPSGPEPREVTVDIPDYFNGTARVMAVAVAEGSIGVARADTIVRGPFVISPNVPSFVAPGDEFIVTATVANNIADSGKEAAVQLKGTSSSQLQWLDDPQAVLKIAPGREGTASFRVKALDELGEASVLFSASLGEKKAGLYSYLSVRPATPYFTHVQSGHSKDKEVDVKLSRALYPQFRSVEATGSMVPLGLAHGLLKYLDGYTCTCTEQAISKVFPALILSGRPEFSGDAKDLPKRTASLLSLLRERQNQEGGFGIWAANANVSLFQVAYAVNFLLEARERGIAVPTDLVAKALNYLSEALKQPPASLADAREQSYALYMLTRSGSVTTNQLDSLMTHLRAHYGDTWVKDLSAVYIAATLQLLKQSAEANKVIGDLKFGEQEADYAHYYDTLVYNSQLLYILAKHFPERLPQVSGDELQMVIAPIEKGLFNTLSAAYSILALDAYGAGITAAAPQPFSIAELLQDKQVRPAPSVSALTQTIAIAADASGARFTGGGEHPLFYQLTEAGFDRQPPGESHDLIEVQQEYRNESNKVAAKIKLGERLSVHVKVRAIKDHRFDNVAIVALIPAGFEVELNPASEQRASAPPTVLAKTLPAQVKREAGESEGEGGGEGEVQDAATTTAVETTPVPSGPAARLDAGGSTMVPGYAEVREDRVVLYGWIGSEAQEFIFKLRSTNRGHFKTPPIYAESMYDRKVQAFGAGGELTVEAP